MMNLKSSNPELKVSFPEEEGYLRDKKEYTFIIYKNSDEYATVKRNHGAHLITKGKKINFKIETNNFNDLIFMKDKYWINVFGEGVYTKSPNEVQPQLFYAGGKSEGCSPGKILTPFFNNKCLLSLKFDNLTIIPISENSPGEVKVIPKICNLYQYNLDYVTIQDNILILTQNSQISLLKVRLNGAKPKIKFLQLIPIEGLKDIEENPYEIKNCKKGKFVLVCMKDNNWNTSSLIIFEIIHRRLIKKNILDVRQFNLSQFSCLSLGRYIGNKIYFSALPWDEETQNIFTFCYDPENEQLNEVSSMRKNFELDSVFKFIDMENGSFGGIGKKSKIFKVEYLIKN